MRLAYYISGHGFGHASRALQVVEALGHRSPELRLSLRTTVPRWFIESGLDDGGTVDVVDDAVDTGLVQVDSLTIDEDGSARAAAAFYATFDERIHREVQWLRAAGAEAVIGDVPPLACAAAHAAGLPSIAVANFTWDWIYAAYPQFDRIAPGVRARISEAYGHTSLAMRLPFAGGFHTMPLVEDTPLIARHATVPRQVTRERLGLSDDQTVVLASFGGHATELPLATVVRGALFTLLVTDGEASGTGTSGLRRVGVEERARLGLRYPDLVAASDVVVSKPGYGIVSECVANGVALLYTSRGRFPEQDVFEREMPLVLRCRHLDQALLRQGRWSEAVCALLAQPMPPGRMRSDGAEVVARRILDHVRQDRS